MIIVLYKPKPTYNRGSHIVGVAIFRGLIKATINGDLMGQSYENHHLSKSSDSTMVYGTYSIVLVQDFRRLRHGGQGEKWCPLTTSPRFRRTARLSSAASWGNLGFNTIYIHTYIHTCRVRSEGRQKACRPTAPKMGPRRSASQRNLSKGAGMPVLFCSKHARLNFDCHKQCKDICTASGSVQDPGRNPPHPQGSKTGFCEWQRWFLGSGAISACAYPHTSRGSSVKLAIRIGSAAKLLRNAPKNKRNSIFFFSAVLRDISSFPSEHVICNSRHSSFSWTP